MAPAQQDGKQVQRNGSQDDRAGEDELESHDQAARRHLLLHRHRMAPAHKADQREANQRGGGVERIDRGRVMGQRDQRAARRRPGHRGELETAAAPGHRPGKVPARDQLRQKRRAGRPEERARRARREQAEIDPEHMGAQRRDQRQAQARARDHKIHQHDNPLAVVVIGDVPRRQREQDHRQHLRQSHQAEGQRRVRPLIEFPARPPP